MALLTTSLLVFVGWVGFLIPESLFHGSVFETIWGEQPSISAEVGSVGIQTWAGLIINVFLCGTLLAGLRCKGAVQRQWSYGEALLAGVVLLGSIPGLMDFGSVLSKAVVVATSGAIFCGQRLCNAAKFGGAASIFAVAAGGSRTGDLGRNSL